MSSDVRAAADSDQPKRNMTDDEARTGLIDRLLDEVKDEPAWFEVSRLEPREETQGLIGHVVDRAGFLVSGKAVFITCQWEQDAEPIQVGDRLRLWRDEDGTAHVERCLP